MKKLITVILLLNAAMTQAQDKDNTYVVGTFNAGYSIKASSPTGGIELGLRTGNLYFAAGALEQIKNISYEPFISVLKIGYNIGKVQVFYAPSYQTIGSNNEAFFKGTSNEFINGIYLAGAGVTYYFNHVSITAMRTGKETNLSAGCYFNF